MSTTLSLAAPPVVPPRLRSVPDSAVDYGAGQEAVDLAAQAGLVMDPWQEAALLDALAERSDGRYAAREVGLVVSRQNGKGSILEARELFGLFLAHEELIVHTAHVFTTARDAFRRVSELVEGTPHLNARVARMVRSPSEMGLDLKSRPTVITGADGRNVTRGVKSRLRFLARTGGSGRGLSGDCIVLDEAYNLPEMAVDALQPTMVTKWNPQLWYTSSAVDQQNPAHQNGLILARVRRRGMKGGDRYLCYLEWSVDEDEYRADPHRVAADPDAWLQANPGLGVRLPRENVEAELGSMTPRSFATERLSVGDWPVDPEEFGGAIPREAWASCANPAARFADAQPALAVVVTPDRGLASIGGAGMGVSGRPHVQLLEQVPTTRAVDELLTLWRKRTCPVVVDPGSPAGSLIPPLEDAGVEVVRMSLTDIGQACGAFYDRVVELGVTHLGQRPLDDAVRVAGTKPVSRDAWKWDSESPGVIAPLVAVSYALHGWVLKGARDPVLNVW